MESVSSANTKYLKRFRMEIDLQSVELPAAQLPDGYRWVTWHPMTLHDHATAKFESFHLEMDSQIFPALRTAVGCRELMQSIMTHRGFLPEATWLIHFDRPDFQPPLPCGTVQGLCQSSSLGAIQNIGVVPEHRGFGLGRALLLQNLIGFRQAGMQRVYLDVTADNRGAVNLYRSVGFKYATTSYKEIISLPSTVG